MFPSSCATPEHIFHPKYQKKNKIIQVYQIQIQHEMVRMISTKRPLPHLLQPTGLGENISSLKLLELGFVTDIIKNNEVAQRNWFRYE